MFGSVYKLKLRCCARITIADKGQRDPELEIASKLTAQSMIEFAHYGLPQLLGISNYD